MGTEILRPHDSFNQRLDQIVEVPPFVFHRRDLSYARFHRKHAIRQIPDRSKQTTIKKVFAGQVTILRRGESLESKAKSVDKNENDVRKVLPEPEKVQKPIRIEDLESFLVSQPVWSDRYAGSAFAMSPSPSALPVPSFSKTKQVSSSSSSSIGANSATRDLRRLLRLD